MSSQSFYLRTMNHPLLMKVLVSFVVLFLVGCYGTPKVEGFDSQRWKTSLANCDDYRLQHVDLLLQQAEDLKGTGQNGMQQMLGKPTRHELYQRNQKFFYYDLNCGAAGPEEQLRIRFDALGNLREMTRELKP